MHLRGVVQQVCLNQKMSSYLLVIVPSGFPNMAHSAIPTNSPVSTTPRIWKVGKVRKTGNRPTRHRAWPPFHCLWRNSKVLPLALLRDIEKRYVFFLNFSRKVILAHWNQKYTHMKTAKERQRFINTLICFGYFCQVIHTFLYSTKVSRYKKRILTWY